MNVEEIAQAMVEMAQKRKCALRWERMDIAA